MSKERGAIVCLIITVVVMLMMLASSDRQLSEVRAKQFENRALIEKNAKDIDELKLQIEQNSKNIDRLIKNQRVEKNGEELSRVEKGK
jgi:hypothetical protein